MTDKRAFEAFERAAIAYGGCPDEFTLQDLNERRAAVLAAYADLEERERMRLAGISTAALGYWKEGDSIHPDYDTVALRDVAKLYAEYDELYRARAAATQPAPFKPTGNPELDAVLLKPDPAFDAFVTSLPANYWARYDLSAVRLGWHHGRAAAGREGQPVSSIDYWQKRGHHVCPECNGARVRSYRQADHLGGQYVDVPCECTRPASKADAEADWVCVPREPTTAMVNAGLCGCMDNDVTVCVYRAMIAASPARGGEGAVNPLCRANSKPDQCYYTSECPGTTKCLAAARAAMSREAQG